MINDLDNLSNSRLLLIFLRNPVLGKTKTRLAKGIGDENALKVYVKLLGHTLDMAAGLTQTTVRLCFTDAVEETGIFGRYPFEKTVQTGEDLGARMQHAFEEGFSSGYKKIVVIGSDLPTLSTRLLESAFTSLEDFDCVIGPASDGGYYLLGLTKRIPEIFKNKKWGTETVLRETLLNLERNRVHLLETLNDIDTADDLKHYPDFA